MLQNIIYFTIQGILFFILFTLGLKIKITPKSYWKLAFVAIFSFALVEGLRFGRGIDYNYYYGRYYALIDNIDQFEEEFGFSFFCKLLGTFGIPYQGFIIVCSLILMYSCCNFLSNHRSICYIAFPLLLYILLPAENLIRWYLGFSFILIGLKHLTKKHFYKTILFFFIGFSMHYALIVVIFIYIGFYFIKKPIFTPKLSLILYCVAVFCSSATIFLGIAKLLPIFLSDSVGRFESYLMNIEYWATGGGKAKLELGIGLLLRHTFIIIAGYKIIKKRPDLTYFYNLLVFGIITYPLMSPIELPQRINHLFTCFEFLFMAYSLKEYLMKKRAPAKMKIYALFTTLFLLKAMFFNCLSMDPNHLLYVWDAAGRDILDVKIYYSDYF